MLGGAQRQDQAGFPARTALRHFRAAYPAFRRDVETVWTDDDCRRYVELLLVCAREGGLRGLPTVRATLYQLREIARLEPLLRPHLAELTRAATWIELRDAMRFAWRGFKLHAYVKIYGNRGRRYFRAWLAERDPGDPLLRKLPLVVPFWRRPPLVAAAAAAGVAALLGGWLLAQSRAPERPLHRAGRVLSGDLGRGPRLIAGYPDGLWMIVRPDGTLEYQAPTSLRLPWGFEGGAVGDVDGDGSPEIALIQSTTLDSPVDDHGRPVPSDVALTEIEAGRLPYRIPRAGVWLFTRAGTGWRLLDRIEAHAGPRDAPECKDVFLDHWKAQIAIRNGRYTITHDLEQRRRRCQSGINAVEIHPGSLRMYLGSYGRAVLEARCDAAGCAEPEVLAVVDADVTGFARAAAPGGRRLLLSTGCWRENSRHAYSLLTVDPGPRGAPPEESAWFGGRVYVTPLDERRVAVVSANPCEGFREQEYLAGDIAAHQGPTLRRVMIGRLDAAGRFVEDQGAALPACCGPDGVTMQVLRGAGGAPVALAVGYDDDHRGVPGGSADDPTAPAHLRLFDLSPGRPLAGSTEVTFPAIRPPALAAADLDGDGADELLVSLRVSDREPLDPTDDQTATRAYRLARAPGGLDLAPLR